MILRYDFVKFFNFFAKNRKFLQNGSFFRIPIKNIDSKKMKTWCYQIDHFPSPMFEYFLIQLRFVTVEHDSGNKYGIICCNPLAVAMRSL